MLDGLIVEVSGITEELLADLVGMLQTMEDLVNKRELAALLEIEAPGLGGGMDLLDPGVMRRSHLGSDMLLELDDVGIWDDLGVGRRKDGRGIIVDGADLGPGGRRSVGGQREEEKASHGDTKGKGEVD